MTADERAADGSAVPPRLLVVTDVALSSGDPGAIFLRALLAAYPPSQLSICEVTPVRGELPPQLAGAAYEHVRRPRERGLHRLGDTVRRATRWLFEQRLRHVEVPRVVRAVTAFGRARGVESVLVVLNGTTVIASAARLARALGVPLRTLVWDPPAYRLADSWALHGSLLRAYLRDFDAALGASVGVAVMSETMRDEFQRRYAVETVLMRLGVAREQWRTHGPRTSADDFVIGYAGSLYARAEWDVLLAALDLVDWKLAGRTVRLRVLSGAFDAHASRPVHIEFLGWHGPDATLDVLSGADLCYLPYWFDPRYAEVVQMSFPSKLSTYVASGTPIFYHGPERSSPSTFLGRYPAGACCHSMEPPAVAAALESCAADAVFGERAAVAGRRALEEELGLHVFHERLAELLGVPISAPARAVAR